MEESVKSKSSIAFIVELFMMFAILLLVIVVITEALVLTRNQSLKARYLNEAVIAAESTAEVAAGAGDADKAAALLKKMENASDVSAEGDSVALTLEYKGNEYKVDVSMAREPGKTGDFVDSTIKVGLAGSDEELYELKTGNYIRNKGGNAGNASDPGADDIDAEDEFDDDEKSDKEAA